VPLALLVAHQDQGVTGLDLRRRLVGQLVARDATLARQAVVGMTTATRTGRPVTRMSTTARQALAGTSALARQIVIGMAVARQALLGAMRIEEMDVIEIAGLSDFVDCCHRHRE